MSRYDQRNEEFQISWDPNYAPGFNFATNNEGNANSEQLLHFQNFEGIDQNVNPNNYYTSNPDVTYMDTTTIGDQMVYDTYRQHSPVQSDGVHSEYEEEEPPLLEELGINPDRIFEKTLAALNPFHSNNSVDVNSLYETDLAGPIALCILLGACLLLAGGKAHFGYVYGLVMISCILMYILLTLMSTEGVVTLGSVASILGYCLLPVVALSVFGVFLPLHSPLGFLCAALSVLWSSLSASKLFVTMSSDTHQRPLIAYPCALLYGTFALIIIF